MASEARGLTGDLAKKRSYLRGPYGVEVINLTGVSIDRSRGLGRKRSPMTFAFIGTSARESQCLSSKEGNLDTKVRKAVCTRRRRPA